MSGRKQIKCVVCNKEVERVGQKLMSHECSNALGEKPSSSINATSENVSKKCTVSKCSFCKKDLVKIGRKVTRHKCMMLLRTNVSEENPLTTCTKSKTTNQNRLVSARKGYRCSLCKKDLIRVGQKVMSHECPKLMGYSPIQTYVKCHWCSELVDQDYKNHKCSTSTHLQSSGEKIGKSPINNKSFEDLNQPQIDDGEKCLLCNGNNRQGLKCDHLKKKDKNLEHSLKYTNEKIRLPRSINVDSWVKEHMDKSVVRFYKPKGSLLHSHPDLSENDLIIMILNEAQCEILKHYGSDCVCLDATEGLREDFELVTMMVLDDHGQGLPCCFMVTNRVDSTAMEILFNVIKTVAGCSIGSSILMTDVSPVMWNAWNVVMRVVPLNWLYSSWKVVGAWKKNLSLIRLGDKRTSVGITLKTLLIERDEATFTQLLGSAIEEWGLDQDTVDFSNYFISEFSHNVINWAYCYRKHLGDDKIVKLEKIHMELKSIYQLTRAKRLTQFIPNLMHFIQDKIHNQKMCQLQSGVSSQIANIIRQHQAARRMKQVQVTKTTEGWSLFSGKKGTEKHEVVVGNLLCDCKLKCDFCKICIHSYKCSCEASSTICPHIHYLAINDFQHNLLIESTIEPTASEDNINVVFDQNLDVDYFVSDLLDESFQPSTTAFETDASHVVLQSPSRKRTHDQDYQHKVDDELENSKRSLRLMFQQILDHVKTAKDAQILETLLNPILPTIVASQLPTFDSGETPGINIIDNHSPRRKSGSVEI